MPFSIHCAGNEHFLYAEGYVSSVGDLFEIQTASERIGGGVTAPLRTLAEQAPEVASADFDALQAGMMAQDAMVAQGILDFALSMALTRMHSLQIDVSARNPGVIFTDVAFASTRLVSGHGDCFSQFMDDIGPALASTGLNGGAVLQQIAHAIRNFDESGCSPLPGHHAPADFMLLIQLAVI